MAEESEKLDQAQAVPVAKVREARLWNWAWALPLVALIFAGGLSYTYVIKRGKLITIKFKEGHGIKIEDTLRCRGIVVGTVVSVTLNRSRDGVVVQGRLEESADDIARSGSSFWIVRPRLSITEVQGLDTIAGTRYIAVLPGDGELQKSFVGLAEPPVVALVEPDGLEVTLFAQSRGSVARGAPILYRQIQVGTVLSVGLASDASSVEVRAYVKPMYRDLVRENTKFWNVSGADMKLGWTGFRFEVESMQSFLDGGVALSTPDKPSKPVRTGHRFELHATAEDDWLEWRPNLVVGSAQLPASAAPPTMLRTASKRTGGRLWQSTKQIKGWVLRLPDGLLGPADMLAPVNKKKHETKAELELGGRQLNLSDKPIWNDGGLMLIQSPKLPVEPWPYNRIRTASEAEDCLIFTDGTLPPVPLDSSRIKGDKHGFLVDRSMSLNRNLHGAAVVARSDGKLIGVLLVSGTSGSIVPVQVRSAGAPKGE